MEMESYPKYLRILDAAVHFTDLNGISKSVY